VLQGLDRWLVTGTVAQDYTAAPRLTKQYSTCCALLGAKSSCLRTENGEDFLKPDRKIRDEFLAKTNWSDRKLSVSTSVPAARKIAAQALALKNYAGLVRKLTGAPDNPRSLLFGGRRRQKDIRSAGAIEP